jgi:hypothetical protein
LAHTRSTLALGDATFVGEEAIRWAWPMAADAALAVADLATVQQLLAWLDAQRPGHIPPVLRAERARIAARLQAAQNDPGAEQAFLEALVSLRELGSPYHLAVGLVDFADYCAATGDRSQARDLAAEATALAERLGARPLRDRADAYLAAEELPVEA